MEENGISIICSTIRDFPAKTERIHKKKTSVSTADKVSMPMPWRYIQGVNVLLH
jgi:hypothetical protein